MAQLYLRKASIAVGDDSGNALDFADFRCTFQVRRGDYQNPNSADIRIYNLAPATENRIQDEFTQVVLQAGYEGSYGLIFRGTIKQVRKGREDAKSTYVDITAADGDEAYNFAPMQLTLAAGSRPQNAIQAMIDSMVEGGVNRPPSLPPLPGSGMPRGQVFHGLARDELRDFCRTNGLSWSIQDALLTFIPQGAYIPGTIPVISRNNGLVGVPEQTQDGITMRVLLNPNIKIGQLVKLDTNAINRLRYGLDLPSQGTNEPVAIRVGVDPNGLYYVMVAEHVGDTRGNAWWTDLVCLSVNAEFASGQAPGTPIPSDAVTG